MKSFINLMANDVWSDDDIMNRMRSMVRSIASDDRRSDLQTIMLGHMSGRRTATASELADINRVQAVTQDSGAMVDQSRLDMLLLLETLALESAQRKLAQPPLEPVMSEVPEPVPGDPAPAEAVVTNQAAMDADAAERVDAQAVVDAASAEALALALLRNPVAEAIPEPAPEAIT